MIKWLRVVVVFMSAALAVFTMNSFADSEVNVESPEMIAFEEWIADQELPTFEGARVYENTSNPIFNNPVTDISTYTTVKYSDDYKTGVYYDELMDALDTLTGNQRLDIVRVAVSQIGYHEGNGTLEYDGENTSGSKNYTEYGRWFGYNDAWCAMFIRWCAYQAGISSNIVYSTASAGLGSFGTYYTYNNASGVQVGDIVCFNSGQHVGLVCKKDSNTETIWVVEGNYNHQVAYNDYSFDEVEITHYYSPNYKNPWVMSNGNWYYYDPDTNELQTGWVLIGNSYYYFDPNYGGVMRTGWLTLESGTYYFDAYGRMSEGWEYIGNTWYYFNTSSGKRMTGWVKINGYWYYLDPDNNGAMQTGWQTIEGETYYLTSSGKMVTGWEVIGDYYYYFNSSGELLTGWLSYNDNWYYLDPIYDGKMTTGFREIDGFTYYFSSSGAMQTGWEKINGDWYYFSSSGIMQTGWISYDGNAYFLKNNGVMVTGTYLVGGYTYIFDEDGKLIGMA